MAQLTSFFSSAEMPAAAAVPHLITALDPALMQSLVRISGAKLALWNVPAPYTPDDAYIPNREGAHLADWQLAYNQAELLECHGIAPGTMIVDSDNDEKFLAELTQGFDPYESETPLHEMMDLGKALKKLNWMLFPLGEQLTHALFLTTQKRDYLTMLQQRCESQGRSFYTIALKNDAPALVEHSASPEMRRVAVWTEAQHLLLKLSTFGIPADETRKYFDELAEQIAKRQKG